MVIIFVPRFITFTKKILNIILTLKDFTIFITPRWEVLYVREIANEKFNMFLNELNTSFKTQR